jgi:hypothetical protein
MANTYVKVSSLDDVSVGDEVKVTPDAETVKRSFPPGTNFATVSVAEMKKMASPKKGTVKSKTDAAIVVDLNGMEMKIAIPPSAGDMFKWTVFKKKVGGRRRKTSRRHKKARHTRRR